MELITREQFALLLLNGEAFRNDPEANPKPVIKLFNPVSSESWLIVSVDPDDPDTAYGLYDSGVGLPELTKVSIEELTNYQHSVSGEGIKRDTNWIPEKSLNEYLAEVKEQHKH